MWMRRIETEDPSVLVPDDVIVPTVSLVVTSVKVVCAVHMKCADTMTFDVPDLTTIDVDMYFVVVRPVVDIQVSIEILRCISFLGHLLGSRFGNFHDFVAKIATEQFCSRCDLGRISAILCECHGFFLQRA